MTGAVRMIHLPSGHSRIVVEPGESARIIEAAGPAQLEVSLGSGAYLEHVYVWHAAKDTTCFSQVTVRQAKDSTYKAWINCSSEGDLRRELVSELAEPNAQCEIYGLSVGTADGRLNVHTRVEHLAEGCKSAQLFKGVYNDQSVGAFHGKIKVHVGADRTDASQYCKNLLLSDQAIVNVQPQLEIDTDDVKCGHGATVGQLDQDALFYLMSRGIAAQMAKQMLVDAFMAEVRAPYES